VRDSLGTTSWTTRQGHQHRYTLAMNYDTIGNIKAKNQNHERLPYEGDSWIEQKGTTYDWTYDHEAKQPHAPTKIDEERKANNNSLLFVVTEPKRLERSVAVEASTFTYDLNDERR